MVAVGRPPPPPGRAANTPPPPPAAPSAVQGFPLTEDIVIEWHLPLFAHWHPLGAGLCLNGRRGLGERCGAQGFVYKHWPKICSLCTI